ncbi:hypothetical protein FRX31_034724 [Thalictrum thalictroides]|uniref:Uncharacterized protein n=1 Tax=Thalictrum thalictroides TaxID=46969 RepID=A0A7J6UT17_THATH|nr:hypothetical protein FRX31_034724 [Thalictrum thalictroides]
MEAGRLKVRHFAKSFSHMLNLANLAGEVQIAYRRRIKLKNGVFTEESNATSQQLNQILKRDLRDWIRICLAQLYAKDITLDDKQELNEARQREIQAAFRTHEIRELHKMR